MARRFASSRSRGELRGRSPANPSPTRGGSEKESEVAQQHGKELDPGTRRKQCVGMGVSYASVGEDLGSRRRCLHSGTLPKFGERTKTRSKAQETLVCRDCLVEPGGIELPTSRCLSSSLAVDRRRAQRRVGSSITKQFCKPGVQALGAPAARSCAANGVRVCAKSETPTDAALRLCEPRYRTCPPRLARKTPAGLHLWSRNGRIGASAEPVSASPVLFFNFLAPSCRDRFARIRRSPLAVDSSAHPRQSGLGWRSYGATSEDLKLIPILGSRPS